MYLEEKPAGLFKVALRREKHADPSARESVNRVYFFWEDKGSRGGISV